MATGTRPAASKSATKKVPAKKAPAAKKAAAPVEDEPMVDDEEAAQAKTTKKAEAEAKRAERNAAREELKAEIVRLHDEEGMKWKEIGEQLDINVVTVHDLYTYATTPRDPRTPTPQLIFELRDDQKLGWLHIGAMFQKPKSEILKLYEEGGHEPHKSFIGKGGRYFQYEEFRPSKPEAAKKSKATTKKASEGNGSSVFADPAAVKLTDAKKRLNNKMVTVQTANGDTAEMKVVSVEKVGSNRAGDPVVQFNDGEKLRTVRLDSIVKVGR
jgi:hypothetical protein